MRKPYSVPGDYEDWEIEPLKQYADNLAHMVTKMRGKEHGIKNAFDRHVFGNAYDELYAVRTQLDERIDVYASKFLLRRLYGVLGEELAAYDKRERAGRIARKQLDAHYRVLQKREG